MTTPPPRKPAPRHHDPRQHEPEGETGRSCLWRLFTVCAWVALAFALLIIGARVLFLALLDPTRRAAIEKADTEIITLPPEWQTAAKVVPIDVVRFQEAFFTEMTTIAAKHQRVFERENPATSATLLQKLQRNDALTTTDQQLLRDFIVDFRPIVEMTSAGVSLPGYTADMENYTTSNWMAVQNFARASGAASLWLAREGKCSEAIDIAILPLRYTQFEPRVVLITHLIAIASRNIMAKSIYVLANECDDAALLRDAITQLDDLRPSTVLTEENVVIMDAISMVSFLKGTGYPQADLSPQPLSGYIDQVLEFYAGVPDQWIVKNLPPTDPRRVSAEHRLTAKRSSRSSSNWKDRALETVFKHKPVRQLVTLVIGYSPVAIISQSWMPNFLEAATREKVANVNFDLARLRVAQRLAELETAATAPIGPDAIKPYIDTIPNDPFSTATGAARALRFSPAHNQFYSLGPDEDDDAMKSQYDSSNGTISNGDIFIKP